MVPMSDPLARHDRNGDPNKPSWKERDEPPAIEASITKRGIEVVAKAISRLYVERN